MASTKVELVKELQEAWIRDHREATRAEIEEMIKKAQQGYYDDFQSPIAFPKMQLVKDLYSVELKDVAQRVQEGDFNE